MAILTNFNSIILNKNFNFPNTVDVVRGKGNEQLLKLFVIGFMEYMWWIKVFRKSRELMYFIKSLLLKFVWLEWGESICIYIKRCTLKAIYFQWVDLGKIWMQRMRFMSAFLLAWKKHFIEWLDKSCGRLWKRKEFILLIFRLYEGMHCRVTKSVRRNSWRWD